MKVKTRSKNPRVERTGPVEYKVWAKAAPEKGRANEEVIESLAVHLGVPKSRVAVISGHASSNKIVEIL